ncbi:MAG: 3'-5' exonuclease [Cryomorphaceae bacterium]|nr:3'-5' exonuclease [Cryomorphaceae bacterium]
MKHWFKKKQSSNWSWFEALIYPPKNSLIQELEFVALDLEMSGLNSKKDRILSIAAVKVIDSEVVLSDMVYIEIDQAYTHPDAAAIHELLPHHGIPEQDALETLAKYCETRPIVGHFTNLDRAFLKAAFHRVGVTFRNDFCDTAALLPRVDHHFHPNEHPSKNDWKLENICQRYNLPNDDMHHATGDALATALLFIRIKRALEKRGVKRLKEIVI